jgi:ABC-type sugar transport system ATPase subunit
MIGHTVINERKIVNENYIKNDNILELQNIHTHKLENVTLNIKKGEIRGIYGLVGSGRSEILHAIYGVDTILDGQITINKKLIKNYKPYEAIKAGIGLLPEDRKTRGIIIDLPVWENIIMVAIRKFLHHGILNYKKVNKESDGYIKQLQIKTPNKETLVRNLSGGNQQKVVIAKWLLEDCEILLVDEPTQGIDVGVKAEIYDILRLLAEKGKTIIIVSSELDELISVSNNISVMYEGKVIKTYSSEEIDSNNIQECAITGRAK